MFDDLLKEIKKLSQQQHTLAFPILSDADGYIDKECPSDECLNQFKVLKNDWEHLFSNESVYCPMCRHSAPSKSWFTKEQSALAKEQAIKVAKATIGQALSRGAESFNRKAKAQNGFLKMSMAVRGHSTNFSIVPIQALDEMRQKLTCESCNAKYAVIGAAFFCPCCGHNPVEMTFSNAIEKVKRCIANVPTIRRAIEDTDAAENTIRHIIESSLSTCVMSLQRFCDKVYCKRADAKNIPQNGFQRLQYMESAWKDVLNKSLSDWLSADEQFSMNLFYQRRHLLQHSDGIVDEVYLKKSNDKGYIVGQRIVVQESDVLLLADIVQKVAAAILAEIKSMES